MPITPHFVLSQSETHVTVDIRVPHVRVSVNSVEVVIDGPTLHFSSPPYLLMLTFPAPFFDDNDEVERGGCAKYDPTREGGMILLTLCKKEPAMWRDLDLMGSLLTPRPILAATPQRQRRDGPGSIISVVSTSEGDTDVTFENPTVPLTVSSSTNELPDLKNILLRPHYGFLNQHSGVFTDLAREGLASEMLQLPNPDETDLEDRRKLRYQSEQEQFDPDRYLQDLDIEDDFIYQSAMNMSPHWQDEAIKNTTTINKSDLECITQGLSELTTANEKIDQVASSVTYFTTEETAQLASIPYPLLPSDISFHDQESLLFGLLDILFAYVYDHLMTEGDPTIESSWAVCTLSITLSWLEHYNAANDTLKDVLKTSIRRVLIYPYLRNYEFAMYCWSQVACIVRNGRRCILRSLLQTRTILDKSECHYLGNRLYIDPYLAWIQRHVSTEQVQSLSGRLDQLVNNHTIIEKDSLDMNLIALEQSYYHEATNESDDGESVVENDSHESSDEDATDDEDSASNDADDDEILPIGEPNIAEKIQSHSRELLDSNLTKPDVPPPTFHSISPKEPRKWIEEL